MLLTPPLQAKSTRSTLFLTYIRNKVDLVLEDCEDALNINGGPSRTLYLSVAVVFDLQ